MAPAIGTLRGTVALAFIAVSTVFWSLGVYLLALVRPLFPVPGRVAIGTAMVRAVDGWVLGVRTMARCLGMVRIDVDLPPGLDRDGWYLVICNHRSWADILVLTFAFQGHIPQFKFLTKREIVWVPFIGLALLLLGFPMLRRYSRRRLAAQPALRERDRAAMRRACAGFRERPTSVLAFAEGTRFTLAKRDREGGPYRHLLQPRSGGAATTLGELGDCLSGIVDATIFYPGPAPTFWGFLSGRCSSVRLCAALLPPTDPDGADREAVAAWLRARWQRKDELLAAAG